MPSVISKPASAGAAAATAIAVRRGIILGLIGKVMHSVWYAMPDPKQSYM